MAKELQIGERRAPAIRVAGPERMRMFMLQHGLNQTKFAKLLRVTRVTLNRWLNEAHRPEPELRERIARATNGFVRPPDWETPEEFTDRMSKARQAAERPRRRKYLQPRRDYRVGPVFG